MVEEQKHYAHERHTENTKTEQGKGNSQRKVRKFSLQLCNIQFHITHSLVLKMWQTGRQGKSNRNISARFVTANMPNGYVLLK